MTRPPDAVVLCGGLGTRIRRLTGGCPKVLINVGGRPFVDILLDRIRVQGITSAILCVGPDGGTIQSYLGDGSRLGMRLQYSLEDEPAGTAGAVAAASRMIRTDPFFVLNGDTVGDVDLVALWNAHRGGKGLMTVARDRDGVPTGAYALSTAILAEIPDRRPCSIERDVIPGVEARDLCGFWNCGWFVDIGTPEGLARAREMFPGRDA